MSAVVGQHLSALRLDELTMGVLVGDEAVDAQAHLAGCDRCRGKLEASRAAQEHFARVVLPRTVDKMLKRSDSWWRSKRWLWPALVVPALAATALAVFLLPARSKPESSEASVAVKGGPVLRIVARRAGKVFSVREGTALAPGDEIRFVVETGGLPYLLVASVDGAGKENVYFPFGGTTSARLDSAHAELPGSVILDDAPGPERVFALFSREPILAGEVTSALRALSARGRDAIRAERKLLVPAQEQVSLLFEKAAR